MRWRSGNGEQRWRGGADGHEGSRLRQLAIAGPFAVLLVLAIVALALQARHDLMAAAAGEPFTTSALPLQLAAGCFLLATGFVVVRQGARVTCRVAGPELTLRRALQRMRAGDLAFRVHLRRGDLLGGLADDCNALLDWLNANPPVGSRTGTDLFDVHPEENELHDVVEERL